MVMESADDSASPGSRKRPRLFIKEMVMRNFKSYAGEQRVGPFHKVKTFFKKKKKISGFCLVAEEITSDIKLRQTIWVIGVHLAVCVVFWVCFCFFAEKVSENEFKIWSQIELADMLNYRGCRWLNFIFVFMFV